MAAIARALESIATKPPEAAEEKRAIEDVEAQRRMAGWAIWMGIFTGAQVFVGAAGVWAVLRTLDQGRDALKKARRANRIARKSAERQLRAYVHVERAEIRWGNKEAANPQITLWVKNTGQTPARWFGLSSQIAVTSDLDGIDEAPFDSYVFDPSRFLQWPALGAQGDTLSVPGDRKSDRDVLVGAFKENLAVQIFGVLLYETIDGEIMESEFWFASRPPHRFTDRLKDGARPNISGLATFGQHEEVPRKMPRASRVLKVYCRSERQVPSREPRSKTDEH